MSSPHDPGRMRIGDHERAQAIQALGEHYALSRLSLTEYEERVDRATGSVTRDDLMALFSDLPAPRPPIGFAQIPQPMSLAPMPYGMPPHPFENRTRSDKSRLAAGLLQILLPFGIGRFYTGHTGIAVAQLLLFFLGGMITCGVGSVAAVIWCVVDGIVLLSTESTDAHGRALSS
ncbi:DUF1707 domain-containing protein [Saccharopolyspora sp. NFXS83]|uniref:DUF1707 domain-containing protein n=1 Tax=Saccharopolyspora sp. NFXS83 TaxID=2993560 RepID=UPI00224A7271|nr:DUF1707 domain-containing protein [Saccharopolyspora sp. NFXS83]MCX2733003.1 DUF1707 domain-containing protein [Saccharopolyspora sp. NFXS83]